MNYKHLIVLLTALSVNALVQATTVEQLEGKAKAIAALGNYLAKPKKVLIDKNNNIFGQNIKKAQTSDLRKKSCGCENATLITAADINPFGFSINVPGEYCLAEDVCFDPVFGDLSAIVINSNDVILHLHKHTLKSNGLASGTVGILVNGVSNVSIDSGCIRGFAQYGIQINPGSSFVTLSQLNVVKNGFNTDPFTFGGGVAISSSNAAQTHDVNLNCVNVSENAFVGLTLAGVDRVNVTNSKFNKNVGTNNFAFGPSTWGVLLIPNGFPITFGSFGCTNINFVNFEANNNNSVAGAIGIEAVSLTGFGFAEHKNLNFLHGEASKNHGGGDTTGLVNEGEGIVLAGLTDGLIEDCRAECNRSLATAPSGIAGFHASVGFGVPFFANNVKIINCVAKNNSGSGDISAGFRAQGSTGVTISHCVAINNNNDAVGGEAWGFTTDTNVGNPTSFGGPVNANFVIDYNKAEKNLAPNGLGGGFKFIAQVGSELSHNCSSRNAIGILVGDPICCQQQTCNFFNCVSTNNVVSYNNVEKNSQAGIVDVTPSANTLYFANAARCNGAPGNNYVGDIFPTPVTCQKPKCCVSANKTPIRLVEGHHDCKVNTNCQRHNGVENLDVRG